MLKGVIKSDFSPDAGVLGGWSLVSVCFVTLTEAVCLHLQQVYDQKNIRRRVYDALNVLMAMNIISKEKKEIRWIGLPTNSAQECRNLEVKDKFTDTDDLPFYPSHIYMCKCLFRKTTGIFTYTLELKGLHTVHSAESAKC